MKESLKEYLKLSEFFGWSWNPLTHEYRVDDEWYQMLGRKRTDEPTAEVWKRIIHPEDRFSQMESILKHIKGETKAYENIYRLQHSNGSWIWVMVRGKVIETDSVGLPIKLAGTYTDITKTMKRQQESESTNDLLKEMITNLPFCVAMFDTGMNFISTSKKWNEFLKLNDSVIGKSIYEVLPHAANNWKHIHERAIKGEEISNDGEKYINEFGEDRWRKWSIKPWYAAEAVAGVILVTEDITEKVMMAKKLEEDRINMIHTARLSSIGEMAAGIAHEINNPLAVMMGYAEMISDVKTGDEGLDQMIKTSSEQISKTGDRICKIVKSLKMYSRNEAPMEMVNCSLKNIVKDSLDLCAEKLKHSKIDVLVNVEDDVWVRGREVELSQVIINLVSNAKDAIKDQSSPWIRIHSVQDQDVVKLYVVDSGKGISRNIVEKIWTPFFTTKPAGQGTGLGLSISKNIIEHQGGKFSIDMDAKNTTFCLALQKAT